MKSKEFKFIVFSCLIAVLVSTNAQVQAKSLDKKSNTQLIESEVKCSTVIWKQEYQIKKNKWIKVDLNGDKKLDSFQVGMDTPNGTKVCAYVKDMGYNLINDSKIGSNTSLFDEYGDLQKNNYIQVSFVDFDNDKKPEIVVAAGDTLTNLEVSIFKCTGEKDKAYEEIGYIEGQSKIIITKNKTIEAPYGSQGLFEQYKYSKGKFVEVNN